MIDPFMIGCGLVADATVSEDAQSVLIDNAEAFLRSGLRDWQFWCSLSEESRSAFIAANDRIWRERCSLIGMASQSQLHATAISDPEAAKDMVASAALDQLMTSIDERQKAGAI